MSEMLIEPFAPAHLDGLIALVAREGWTEYTDDAARSYRALTAPGVTTLVAIADQRVAGAIQVQSDAVIQAHVSMLLIDRNSRGGGLGSRLLIFRYSPEPIRSARQTQWVDEAGPRDDCREADQRPLVL